MKIAAKKVANDGGMVHLKFDIPVPTNDMIEPNGTVVVSFYLTMRQWQELVKANGMSQQSRPNSRY